MKGLLGGRFALAASSLVACAVAQLGQQGYSVPDSCYLTSTVMYGNHTSTSDTVSGPLSTGGEGQPTTSQVGSGSPASTSGVSMSRGTSTRDSSSMTASPGLTTTSSSLSPTTSMSIPPTSSPFVIQITGSGSKLRTRANLFLIFLDGEAYLDPDEDSAAVFVLTWDGQLVSGGAYVGTTAYTGTLPLLQHAPPQPAGYKWTFDGMALTFGNTTFVAFSGGQLDVLFDDSRPSDGAVPVTLTPDFVDISDVGSTVGSTSWSTTASSWSATGPSPMTASGESTAPTSLSSPTLTLSGSVNSQTGDISETTSIASAALLSLPWSSASPMTAITSVLLSPASTPTKSTSFVSSSTQSTAMSTTVPISLYSVPSSTTSPASIHSSTSSNPSGTTTSNAPLSASASASVVPTLGTTTGTTTGKTSSAAASSPTTTGLLSSSSSSTSSSSAAMSLSNMPARVSSTVSSTATSTSSRFTFVSSSGASAASTATTTTPLGPTSVLSSPLTSLSQSTGNTILSSTTIATTGIPSSTNSRSRSHGSSRSSTSSSSPTSSVYPAKRGLAYTNVTTLVYYPAPARYISWSYNYYSLPNASDDAGVYPPNQFHFIPLLYNDATSLTSIWASNVNTSMASYNSDAIFGFNEPDACYSGQSACMNLSRTIQGYANYMQPFSGRVLIGAPAVTNSGNSGLSYLAQFLANATQLNLTVDFLNLHWYASPYNIQYFQDYLTQAYTQTGQSRYPVWVSEFGMDRSDYPAADVVAFLKNATRWMDLQPWVARYAWFGNFASGATGTEFLLDADGSGRSSLGDVWYTYNGTS